MLILAAHTLLSAATLQQFQDAFNLHFPPHGLQQGDLHSTGCLSQLTSQSSGSNRQSHLVVALHGYTACTQQFEGMRNILESNGYDVMLVNLQGHGLERQFEPNMYSCGPWYNPFQERCCVYGKECKPQPKGISSLPTEKDEYDAMINRLNDVVALYPGKKSLVGISLGAANAAIAATRKPNLYDSLLLLTMLTEMGDSLANNALNVIQRIPWMYSTPIGWGENCEFAESAYGRKGYCAWNIGQLIAARELGRSARGRLEAGVLDNSTTVINMVTVEEDGAASSEAVRNIANRFAGKPNVPGYCQLPAQFGHSFISSYDNPLQNKFWLAEASHMIASVAVGRNFPTPEGRGDWVDTLSGKLNTHDMIGTHPRCRFHCLSPESNPPPALTPPPPAECSYSPVPFVSRTCSGCTSSSSSFSGRMLKSVVQSTDPAPKEMVEKRRQLLSTNNPSWMQYEVLPFLNASTLNQEGCTPLHLPASTQEAKGYVLLLHSYTACPNELIPVADELRESGYEVFIPLLPGHGKLSVTDGEDNLDDLPVRDDDYYTFLDQMNQVMRPYSTNKPCIVGGIGYGGTLAMRLTEMDPHLYTRSIIVSPFTGNMPDHLDHALASFSQVMLGYQNWGGARIYWDQAIGDRSQGWCMKEKRAGYCSFTVDQMNAIVNVSKKTFTDAPKIMTRTQIMYSTPNLFSNTTEMLSTLKRIASHSVCHFEHADNTLVSPYATPWNFMWWLQPATESFVTFLQRGTYVPADPRGVCLYSNDASKSPTPDQSDDSRLNAAIAVGAVALFLALCALIMLCRNHTKIRTNLGHTEENKLNGGIGRVRGHAPRVNGRAHAIARARGAV